MSFLLICLMNYLFCIPLYPVMYLKLDVILQNRRHVGNSATWPDGKKRSARLRHRRCENKETPVLGLYGGWTCGSLGNVYSFVKLYHFSWTCDVF